MDEENSSEEHIVKVLKAEWVTHDVKQFTLSKPDNYLFKPGQATELAINLPEWKSERRPFTFTSLNDWDSLEFTIKIYDDHKGVTHQLGLLEPGAELVIHDIWGAIHYKGEGVFIAGGAGVTPYIAIFRQLNKDGKIGNNRLIFSNKKEEDIILKNEFQQMLGDHFINTLTDEKTDKYDHQMINKDYLQSKINNLNQYFYICGPEPMIDSVKRNLEEMGVAEDKIVIEQF